MTNRSRSEDEHPAKQQYDQLAWAVWLRNGRKKECVSVIADSEAEAKQKAKEQGDLDPKSVHIDGPFGDSEPAIFEFEFVTVHRERVVVEAPTKEYAEETAEGKRDYMGEYKRTTRTETRRIPLQRYQEDNGDE